MAALSPIKEPRSSAGSSVLSLDPAQVVKDRIITRIQSVIQRYQWIVPDECLQTLERSITQALPEDPVVTKCGHLFNRATIQKWLHTTPICPVCETLLSPLDPPLPLRSVLSSSLKESGHTTPMIPTCSDSTYLNPKLAAQPLDIANRLIKEKKYKEALDAYHLALQYTNLSIDYAAVPQTYDQLQEREKAILSRLYLSLYQLKEGHLVKAQMTLQEVVQGLTAIGAATEMVTEIRETILSPLSLQIDIKIKRTENCIKQISPLSEEFYSMAVRHSINTKKFILAIHWAIHSPTEQRFRAFQEIIRALIATKQFATLLELQKLIKNNPSMNDLFLCDVFVDIVENLAKTKDWERTYFIIRLIPEHFDFMRKLAFRKIVQVYAIANDFATAMWIVKTHLNPSPSSDDEARHTIVQILKDARHFNRAREAANDLLEPRRITALEDIELARSWSAANGDPLELTDQLPP